MMLLEDLLIAARTIYGEARGEPFEGQKAVAHVIINRGGTESIGEACLRPFQFSCWNPSNPTYDKVVSVTIADKELRVAFLAFLTAIDELDFTNGARWYHAKSVSPSWSQGKVPVLVVGNHRFFNNIT